MIPNYRRREEKKSSKQEYSPGYTAAKGVQRGGWACCVNAITTSRKTSECLSTYSGSMANRRAEMRHFAPERLLAMESPQAKTQRISQGNHPFFTLFFQFFRFSITKSAHNQVNASVLPRFLCGSRESYPPPPYANFLIRTS